MPRVAKSKTENTDEVEVKEKKTTTSKAKVTKTAEKEPKAVKTVAKKEPKTTKQPKEKKDKSNVIRFDGTGRRKESIARVNITSGSGNITINGKKLEEYFIIQTLQLIVKQPLTVTNSLDKYDINCNVLGGGKSGQAGAIRHGIARSLLKVNPEFRPALKSAGFLTRDPRMKERKKYGLKKARKAPQFSKR